MTEEDENTKLIGKFIPTRFMIAIMVAFDIALIFGAFVTLPLAYHYLVAPSVSNYSTTCLNYSIAENYIPRVTDDVFDWTPHTMSIFHTAFDGAMFLSIIPFGVLADKYGGKNLLSYGTLASGVSLIASPLLFQKSRGNLILISILRFFMGVAGGAIFPAACSVTANWAPPCDRGKLTGIIFAAHHFSIVFNIVASNRIIQATKSWQSIFYIYGSAMLIWFLFWHWSFYSKPADDHSIKIKEREFLEANMVGIISAKKAGLKWEKMFTSLAFWSSLIASFAGDSIWGVVTHVHRVYPVLLSITISETYEVVSYAYICLGIVILINGFLLDFLINNQYINITTSRKLSCTWGLMGPGVFFLATLYTECDNYISNVFFIIGMAFIGFSYGGSKINCLDLAPNYSGVLMSFNIISSGIPSLLLPVYMHHMAPDNTVNQWRHIFWMYFGILSIADIFYMIFGKGEIQPWNNSESHERKASTNNIAPPTPVGDYDVESEWSEVSDNVVTYE